MLTLGGVIAKLDRAKEDIDQLAQDLASFCEIQSHNTKTEINAEQERIQLTFRGSPPVLPLKYSVQIGEIAYNLRSALDHLVWQLVLANYKRPTRSNEFPIFTDAKAFQKAKTRKLSGVSRESVDRITVMQPFCEDPRWPLLGALQELCNIDKHRTLHLPQLRWDVLIDNQSDRAVKATLSTRKDKEVEFEDGQVLCWIPNVTGVHLSPIYDVMLVGPHFEGVGQHRAIDAEPHTAFALRELLTHVQNAVMYLAGEILASPFAGPPKKFGITAIEIPETDENRSFNDAPKHIRDALALAYVSDKQPEDTEIALQFDGSFSFNGTIHTSSQEIEIRSQAVSNEIVRRTPDDGEDR